jgi:hypothetical protein
MEGLMLMRVVLTFDGAELDQYEFDAKVDGDIEVGVRNAYTQFRRKHPGVSLFDDGSRIDVKKAPGNA